MEISWTSGTYEQKIAYNFEADSNDDIHEIVLSSSMQSYANEACEWNHNFFSNYTIIFFQL
jgi:hypothetical protein